MICEMLINPIINTFVLIKLININSKWPPVKREINWGNT